MTWGWLLPVVGAWALLCAPGALLLIAGGACIGWRWGAAPAITVLLAVVLGALDHLLGIPWTPVTAGVQLLVVLVLVLGARRLIIARERGSDRGADEGDAVPSRRRRRPRALVLALAPGALALALGLLMAGSAARHMGGIDTLNGSYDASFHIAAIAFVRADRDAFLFTALQGIYHETTFYPAGWDVLAALLPGDAITAANAMALALVAAIPGALGAMVALLQGGRGTLREVRVLPMLAALCAPMFLSLPVMILVMGLWPSALGSLCLPPALGALWAIHRAVRSGERRAAELWPCALLLVGAVAAHPSTLFSLAVALLAGILAQGVLDVTRARTRRRGVLELAVIALVLLVYGITSHLLLASMDLTTTRPWPWTAFLASLVTDRPRVSALGSLQWPILAVWALALLGATQAVRERRRQGTTAIVLLVLALGLSILTNLDSIWARTWVNPWYGARERIAPLLMCALVALAAIGLDALWARDARAEGEGHRLSLGTSALVVLALVSLVAAVLPGRLPFAGSLAYTDYGVQIASYATPEERDFIERTAAALPADAVVIGNPRDGEGLYWSIGGVETVFPTLAEPQTLDSRRVARYAFKADRDAKVCTSLHNVGPTHLYVDTSADSGEAIAPEASVLWEGLAKIPRSKLRLVDREGPYALYEIEPLC
ncbi:hypothetical protein I8D64_12195 [Brachybacterium sp. MASK1Z-5]|uniref:Beta-carotene 15,15'-monooxygenase n=1 Tax=Brachybacterium halotolerans TaxID=2795215 RepID=A0ABS1BBZ9_9MICO|nr:DUF6541 family protein [Brachybacterium halotolerans]MBK0332156.1 hypothetical protein [Brachybacterium halotolerans]